MWQDGIENHHLLPSLKLTQMLYTANKQTVFKQVIVELHFSITYLCVTDQTWVKVKSVLVYLNSATQLLYKNVLRDTPV